jgi:signal recognition particle receptor subunit beta
MVLINYAGREINAKIVYYGPGLSGKTTNLECIYASVPTNSRGKMVSMKTRQDRTLFFDFLPLELGEVHGFRTRFLLYTVPGQVFYNATRKLVLKGADAVVFVADSGLGKMEENLESLRNLDENLREQGLTLEGLPFVLQYNKRDLAELHSIEELEQTLNPRKVPSFEAAAASGRGVYETLHAVSRLLFQRLLTELRPGAARGGTAPTPPSPGAPAPAGLGRGRIPGSPGLQRTAPGASAPVPAVERGPRAPAAPRVAVEARQPAPQLSPRAPEPGLLPEIEPEESPAVVPPQLFGSQSFSHVPQPPTTERILHSVQASAEALEITDPEPVTHTEADYSRYGHVVDLEVDARVAAAGAPELAVEPQPQLPAGGDLGLIKDPLRRREAQAGRTAGGGGPVVTKQATVVVSRSELQQGRGIRILLELRVEP